jgi:hypothetical protein
MLWAGVACSAGLFVFGMQVLQIARTRRRRACRREQTTFQESALNPSRQLGRNQAMSLRGEMNPVVLDQSLLNSGSDVRHRVDDADAARRQL